MYGWHNTPLLSYSMPIPTTAFKASLYARCLCETQYCVIEFLLSTSLVFLVFHIWTILYKSFNKSVKSTACWTQTCSRPKRLRPQERKLWTGLFSNFVLAEFLWYIGMSGSYSNLLIIFKIKVLVSETISSIEQWKQILLMHVSRNISPVLAIFLWLLLHETGHKNQQCKQ